MKDHQAWWKQSKDNINLVSYIFIVWKMANNVFPKNGELLIIDINYLLMQKEYYYHVKIKINTFFKNNNEWKIRKYNTNIYKSTKILDGIFLTNKKLFVTVHPKNVRKLESTDSP